MKKHFLLLTILIVGCLCFSCNSKSNKEQANEESNKNNSNKAQIINTIPDSVLILGYWKRDNKPMWFEFKKDGTYAAGKGKSEKEKEGQWSIDTAHDILRLQTPKGLKQMRYILTKENLSLTNSEKDKVIGFKRVKGKPE